MAQLIRQYIFLIRNVPIGQGNRMELGLLNNLAGHVAHHRRDSSPLIPLVRHYSGIVTHKNHTLPRQLGEKSGQC